MKHSSLLRFFKPLHPGQSLVEGLVALSMASIIIVAVIATVTASVATSRITGIKNRANQLAQEGIEIVRTQMGVAEGFYCLGEDEVALGSPVSPSTCDNEANIDNTFARSVEIDDTSTQCSAGVRSVVVSVAWQDSQCSDGEFCQSSKINSCIDREGGLIAGNFPVQPTITPTCGPPPAVQNISPASGTYTPGPRTVSWSDNGADTYIVQIYGGPSGMEQFNPGGTSFTRTFDAGRTYDVVVYAYRCGQYNGYSGVTLTIQNPTPAPTVDINASQTSIAYNTATTLSWTSTNATSCTASNGWSGTKSTASSESTGNLIASRTYTLTCTGPGGSGNDSVTVTVGAPPPAPTVNLSASPTSIAYNAASTLSWSTSNATSCTASGSWSGSKATSGSQSTGQLTTSRTYTLTCTGAGGSGNDSVTVTVASKPSGSVTQAAFSSTTGLSTSTVDNEKRTLMRIDPNVGIVLTQIGCYNCGSGTDWRIYLADSNGTQIGSVLRSGTSMSVSGSWATATISPSYSMGSGTHLVIGFNPDPAPTSTKPLYFKNDISDNNLVDYLKYSTGSNTTWNEGAFYVRTTFTLQ